MNQIAQNTPVNEYKETFTFKAFLEYTRKNERRRPLLVVKPKEQKTDSMLRNGLLFSL